MERKNRFLMKLLSLAMVLVLVIGMVACGNQDPTTAPSQSTQPTTESTAPTDPTTESTEPTTQPTGNTTGTTGTTGPTIPTIPPMGHDCDLEYTLTQEDVDQFYTLLAECEALSLAGEDMDAIDASIEALDASFEFMNAQCSIAMILHYGHTKDEALEKQYLDCVDICTAASDAYMQMIRRIYLSDSPAKDSLFEGWTEKDFADLMAYDEQIAQLQSRNAEIGVEYRAEKDDAVKMQLYIEMVQNNNTIARFYGYDNYYEYAYREVYDRDYDAEAVEQLRNHASRYVIESYTTALNNFYTYYNKLNNDKKSDLIDFLYEDFQQQGKDYVGIYLHEAPENLNASMWDMLLNNSYFPSGKDSNSGAFTTTIGDRSYCYFSKDYTNCNTIIHEGGHYYASLYTDLNAIPLDLAEVHSQGNEWLFNYFVQDHMRASQYKALINYRLYEAMSMVLICLMVDEFEQIVYSTDLTGYTSEDMDAIMDEVALRYFPLGNVESNLADMNSYWRMVVVDQPVYYISYAVSAIASVSLYTEAVEDFDNAMAIYVKLCEEVDVEAGFLGNIRAAGLYTPFDEEFYVELRQIVYSLK